MKKTFEELKETLKELDYPCMEYACDDNLDDDSDYVETVQNNFEGGKSISDAYAMNLDSFIPGELSTLLENAEYLSENVDNYLEEVGASTLQEALQGGYRDYYQIQANANIDSIYGNTIIADIKKTKEELLRNEDTLTYEILMDKLPICSLEYPEDIILDFISDEVSNVNYYFIFNTKEELLKKFKEYVKETLASEVE